MCVHTNHCIWTLPADDSDYATRWRLIKTYVTKPIANQLPVPPGVSDSRRKRQEKNLWQRRFWEHLIRDEADYRCHCDYIHYNPVKHGLCGIPADWPYSSFQRFVQAGIYAPDWGHTGEFTMSKEILMMCDWGDRGSAVVAPRTCQRWGKNALRLAPNASYGEIILDDG